MRIRRSNVTAPFTAEVPPTKVSGTTAAKVKLENVGSQFLSLRQKPPISYLQFPNGASALTGIFQVGAICLRFEQHARNCMQSVAADRCNGFGCFR
jgi:hypothetical protein